MLKFTIYRQIILRLYRILIEEYYSLYKSSRLDTLKALNDSQQIEIAESVKLKILFSIVVVSIHLSLPISSASRLLLSWLIESKSA